KRNLTGISIQLLGGIEVNLTLAAGLTMDEFPPDPQLRLWSDTLQAGEILDIDGPNVYTFANLMPADDYVLHVQRASMGRYDDGVEGIRVLSGLSKLPSGTVDVVF